MFSAERGLGRVSACGPALLLQALNQPAPASVPAPRGRSRAAVPPSRDLTPAAAGALTHSLRHLTAVALRQQGGVNDRVQRLRNHRPAQPRFPFLFPFFLWDLGTAVRPPRRASFILLNQTTSVIFHAYRKLPELNKAQSLPQTTQDPHGKRTRSDDGCCCVP